MTPTSDRSQNPHATATSRRKKGVTLIKVLVIVAILGLAIVFFLPVHRGAREAARRNSCVNNLKQIALALHNYADVYHALPPAYTADADGKPLHSWRTLILPYMEESQLYKTIDLSKPWDDPTNAKAFNTAISGYQCPSDKLPANQTTYLAIVGPNSCLKPGEYRTFADITDGTAKTLMVIEVSSDQAVPWMSPKDADVQAVMGFTPDSKLVHAGGCNAAFVDGSVRFLDADLPAADRRAMISIAGNDKVAEDD